MWSMLRAMLLVLGNEVFSKKLIPVRSMIACMQVESAKGLSWL